MMIAVRALAVAFALILPVGSVPAQSPSPNPASPPAADSAEPFGMELPLPQKTIVYLSGTGRWDSAFDTIQEALRTVSTFLERQGVKPSGDPLVIYTGADDASFQFQAAYPISEPLKNPPQGDLAMGPTPTGPAYKFVHRGSYDAMDNTYEAITNFLDEKNIEAKDMFIEEYTKDPLTVPQEDLVINVWVPTK